jgi:hypothetical protein
MVTTSEKMSSVNEIRIVETETKAATETVSEEQEITAESLEKKANEIYLRVQAYSKQKEQQGNLPETKHSRSLEDLKQEYAALYRHKQLSQNPQFQIRSITPFSPTMGICSSCESTSVATVKLILQDGKLLEFPHPVKVSYVLQKSPSTFICNSDDMEFDDVVIAIDDDQELELGQLYFALPLNRLRSPLQPEEMAALAVKASSALSKSGGEICGCRRKDVNFTPRKSQMKSSRVADGAVAARRRRGKGRDFTAMLTAIPE